MKKYILLCVLCFLCGASQAQKIRIKTGIEVLKDQNFKVLGRQTRRSDYQPHWSG